MMLESSRGDWSAHTGPSAHPAGFAAVNTVIHLDNLTTFHISTLSILPLFSIFSSNRVRRDIMDAFI
jgi:hypothetical protein